MYPLSQLHHIYTLNGNILSHHPWPYMNVLLSQFSKDGCIYKQRLPQVRPVRILICEISMPYQGTCMIISLNSPVLNEIYSIDNWFRQTRFGVTTHCNDFSLQGTIIHFFRCPFECDAK